MVKKEDIVMELVVNSGEARSYAMEAIKLASKEDFETAIIKLEEAEKSLSKAHLFQTNLIQEEASDNYRPEFSLLLVHAQDHLMYAITIRDLAKEMVKMYQIIYKGKGEGND